MPSRFNRLFVLVHPAILHVGHKPSIFFGLLAGLGELTHNLHLLRVLLDLLDESLDAVAYRLHLLSQRLVAGVGVEVALENLVLGAELIGADEFGLPISTSKDHTTWTAVA